MLEGVRQILGVQLRRESLGRRFRDGDKLISFTFQSTDKLLAAASLERETFLRERTQLDAAMSQTYTK
jgi:hypothetical protein